MHARATSKTRETALTSAWTSTGLLTLHISWNALVAQRNGAPSIPPDWFGSLRGNLSILPACIIIPALCAATSLIATRLIQVRNRAARADRIPAPGGLFADGGTWRERRFLSAIGVFVMHLLPNFALIHFFWWFFFRLRPVPFFEFSLAAAVDGHFAKYPNAGQLADGTPLSLKYEQAGSTGWSYFPAWEGVFIGLLFVLAVSLQLRFWFHLIRRR